MQRNERKDGDAGMKIGKRWKGRMFASGMAVCLAMAGCGWADMPWNGQRAARERQKFDEMAERLFLEEITSNTMNLHFLLADPEAYGIEEYEVTLGSYTLEEVEESLEEMGQVKEELEGMEYRFLTKEQQITYETLDYYLDTELGGEDFLLYANPLSPTIGAQVELPLTFADYNFYDKQDVEDYLELLSQIDAYYGQIMDYERMKSKEGLFMSDRTADKVIESCRGYLTAPKDSFLTETFAERLDGVEELSSEEKEAYKAKNLEIMEQDFIPAYEDLMEGLEELKGTGVNEQGLYYFPKGKEYYQYLLSTTAGVNYKDMGKLEKEILDRVNGELREMKELLMENPEILDGLGNYAFALSDPDEILTDLQRQIQGRFPEIPQANYRLKYVPEALEDAFSPAACLPPPLDRPEENVIYINGAEDYENYDMYTLLAHEGYPGHLYQNIYFHESGVSNLRNLLKYTSYSEGWATYVEYLAYGFDNGLTQGTGALLAKDSSINMGITALLDLYIHYYGWDVETTAEYLAETMRIEEREMVEEAYQQIVDNPGNYMKYYLGYLKIADMRKEAEKKLGSGFQEVEFHKFLLDMGPAPFSVIEKYFEEDYLGGR